MKKRRELAPREQQAQRKLLRIWQEKRKTLRLTQEEAAHRMGFKTQGAVNQYLNGKIPLNTDAILKFSALLEVSPTDIDGEFGIGNYSKIAEAAPIYLKGGKSVPLISWVQAGDWCEAVNNREPGDADAWLNCPVPCGPRTFALKVQGISMEPEVKDGEIIFVDPDEAPQHKDLVVVRLESGEATFKQILYEGNQATLQAINPDWPTRIIPVDSRAIICGVVIFHGKSRR